MFLLSSFGSCEREIPTSATQGISGYRIEGTVTDQLSNPIPGVDVFLYYELEYVDSDSQAQKSYNVTDTTKILTAVVRDWLGHDIRTLFNGKLPMGSFTANWDTKDSSGSVVPSNAYRVHYVVGGVSQQWYPVMVSGSRVTTTDVYGHYVIPGENLPVLFYPVPLYSSDGSYFYGNYRITPYVTLLFTVSGRSRTASHVQLGQDRITQIDIVIG